MFIMLAIVLILFAIVYSGIHAQTAKFENLARRYSDDDLYRQYSSPGRRNEIAWQKDRIRRFKELKEGNVRREFMVKKLEAQLAELQTEGKRANTQRTPRVPYKNANSTRRSQPSQYIN